MFNILLIGNFGVGWDGSICDEENVAKALESLGHKVFRLPRDAEWTIPVADYDFTLIFQWDNYPDDLSRLPKPLIYWAFDYQDQTQEWHKNLIKQSDLYLSKRLADSIFPNWHWACDFAPDFLHAETMVEKDIDILFTGSYLPWAVERNETLSAIDDKYNLVIHSVNDWPGFKHVNPPVMDHGLSGLIARAKINLAIDHTLEAGYWSDRAAQIISCGGFCLQRYVPMMESYFHSTVAYFYGIEDCLEAIDWWLDRDEDRDVIAAEALEFSPYVKCNTRVADVLDIIRSIL